MKLWILFSFILVLSASITANEIEDDDDFEDAFVGDDLKNEQPKEKYIAPRYQTPEIDASKCAFMDLFDDKKAIGKKWFKSQSKKEGAEEAISKYDGEWSIDEPSDKILEGDYGLIVRTKARHHAISAKFQHPFKFDGKHSFVLQYEVKYQEGQECGGGYLKMLESHVADNLKEFNDKTPYVVMFGPDKCGMSSKIHMILRHKNPKNGTVSEHHAKQSSKSLTNFFDDKKAHLYTLVINPDNTFRVTVDKNEIMSGNLLTDLEPPITPPKQIPDPEDKKPAEWDDRVMIDDPDAKKPEDWDENQPKQIVDEDAARPEDWLEEEEALIPDPESTKPDDWDDEMDGEWEPRKMANPACKDRSGCGKWTKPMKENPLYKGKWSPPRISNPNYKGPWSPKQIDNPHYFEGINLSPISVVGIEIWTMSSGIVFDNIIVTDDEGMAKTLAAQTFDVKKAQENIYQSATSESTNIFKNLLALTEEKPWLWIVIIVGLLIPVILISVFCFGRKTRSDHKKTDEPVEDDDVVEMDEAAESEENQQIEENEAGVDEDGQESDNLASREEQGSTATASSSAAESTSSTPNQKKKILEASSSAQQTEDSHIDEQTQPAEQSSPRPTTKRVRARRQE